MQEKSSSSVASDSPIIYTADAIAFTGDGRIVLVERLGGDPGFALPGGKQNPGEALTDTVIRETEEETGLIFMPDFVFRAYAAPGRDSRGHYVTTVFVGKVVGKPRDEEGKTRVHLVQPEDLGNFKGTFYFDHEAIINDYLGFVANQGL